MKNAVKSTLFLALGHLANDFYPGLLSPLLPIFIDRQGWSMAQVGVLVTVSSIFCNFTQPFIGIINDHRPTKSFMWFGLVLSALPFCCILNIHSLEVMAVAVAVSGLGVGIFHPVAVVAAGHIAVEKRRGLLMALFSSGGNVGVMFSPLAAILIIEYTGDRFMPLLILPGVITALYFAFDKTIVVKESHGLSLHQWFLSFFETRRELSVLFLISLVRAVVQTLLSCFLPILAMARGFSYAKSAFFLSSMLFAGMIGMFIGGHLSDIHGRKKIMASTMFVSAPLLLGFLYTRGVPSITLLLIGMATLSSTLPINIIQAQKTNPKLAGMASSLVMGLSYTVAGLTAAPFGLLADHVGIEQAMIVPVALPVFGGLMVFLLKNE